MTNPQKSLRNVIQIECGPNTNIVVDATGRITGAYDFVLRGQFLELLGHKEACQGAWRCIVNKGNPRHADVGVVCRRFAKVYREPVGSDFERAQALVRGIEAAFATDVHLQLDLGSCAIDCVATSDAARLSFDCPAVADDRLNVHAVRGSSITIAPEINAILHK